MNYHNVRDSKGRFTPSTLNPTANLVSVPVSGSSFNPAQSKKDFYLDKLKHGVYTVTHERKNGITGTNSFTLMPSHLTGYVGKGSSKSAPSDLIFAYEIDDQRFYGIDVNSISYFEEE